MSSNNPPPNYEPTSKLAGMKKKFKFGSSNKGYQPSAPNDMVQQGPPPDVFNQSTSHVIHSQAPPSVYVQQPAPQFAMQQQSPVVFPMNSNICVACRVGTLRRSYTCCGIFLAIIFFPLGIICCVMMKEKRCANCGFTYG